MKFCPKGAIVNKKELGELVHVLDVAIENNVVLIDSNLPPKSVPRKAWSKEDKENFAVWHADIRRWRKLRRLLAEAV